MIQCAREIGLAGCFAGLLKFEGSECYFKAFNSGEGYYDDGITRKSFMDACYRFKDAAVIGVRFGNVNDPNVLKINPSKRPVMLNPPGDYEMQMDDKLLVLAEDNDTFDYGPSNNPDLTPVPPYELPPKFPEKILLLGWRRDFEDLVLELDKWVPPNSKLTFFNTKSVERMKKEFANAELDFSRDFRNISADVEFISGDPCNGLQLERLGPKMYDDDWEDRLMGPTGNTYRLEQYDLVLNLCEEDKQGSGDLNADSRVMVSMLIMRYIETSRRVKAGGSGNKKTMVAEILDPRTSRLMALTECAPVVGNELVAMMLAQVSEDRDIGYVLEDLFSEEGMEMHLKDIRLFVAPNELLNWWELVGRCMQRTMLPIGWIQKRRNEDGTVSENLEINPANKDEKFIWNGQDGEFGDQLIVVSED